MKKDHYIPLRYDLDALNKGVPIDDVLRRYAGIDTSKKGNISCPSPNHQDKKPSAHIYSHTNTCTCFACGKTFTPISVVVENMNTTLPNACQMLIDDYNLPLDMYSNLREVQKARNDLKHGKKTEVFPLTPQECKLIGLDGAMTTTVRNELYDIKDYDDEVGVIKYSFGDKYLQVGNLVEYWKNDRAFVQEILLNKCAEKLFDLNNMIEFHTNNISEIIGSFAKNKYEEATKLQTAYRKYNTPEKPVKLSQSQFDLLCMMSMIEQEEVSLAKAVNDKGTVEQLKLRIEEYGHDRVHEKKKSEDRGR